MKRIAYPEQIYKFKKEYISFFNDSMPSLKRKWIEFRNRHDFLRNHLPKNIVRIMLADYNKLVKYYIAYTKSCTLTDSQKKDLVKIFNYDNFQPLIARFFMEKAAQLSIHTCFYCESAYINVYTDGDVNEHLRELNSISDSEFKKILKTESNKTLNHMKRHRPFKSIDEFDEAWASCRKGNRTDKYKSIFPTDLRNHFDLDHVLDKDTCPLVGLSLMNFVPSCPVCNEKLKRSKVLGSPEPLEFLSPTSPLYDFDGIVKIRLEQTGLKVESEEALDQAYALDYPDSYNVKFECLRPEYETIVEIFKLQERYAFHKLEGLNWLVMKSKYNDTNIKMMADSFKSSLFSEFRIKEDIFHYKYDEMRHPCFEKFKRDILN